MVGRLLGKVFESSYPALYGVYVHPRKRIIQLTGVACFFHLHQPGSGELEIFKFSHESILAGRTRAPVRNRPKLEVLQLKRARVFIWGLNGA